MLCKILGLITLALALNFGASASLAQNYPTKPVRLIVGFSPGGGTDIVARLLAQKLSTSMGQSFIVDNRPGATGMIAAVTVATAPADGYTLLLAHVNSQAIAPALVTHPLYDPIKDFAPVAYIGYVPNVLVVSTAMPVRTVAELVARANSLPKGLSYASPGVGSTNHLAGEMLRMESGAHLVHVPYKGSAPAMADLIGGQIDLNFDVTASVMPYLKSGRLRALAVTAQKRDTDLPDVPTMRELGFKTFDITNWYGVAAPRGTATAAIRILHDGIQRSMQMPDLAAKLDELGVRRDDMTSEQFGQFIHAQYDKYSDFAKRSGIRIEQ
jgi:tripartite-type tricarboxylate transporter receptor subunit TctC